ncbi:cytochrome c oxidase assembly protein-like protein cox15 [Hyaloscypha bicolor E]|uniref:Cytochrome c oxidase assembly protein-like protein cox15 n=1 Tax=Hyaloscypha bicolor E TaxID=1095630 RepID=A0A2J6TRM4_9HELO|nr:cytochrome c oxidase assembly protein-like protein cox15 [Hyaloscypha bicolor E]PMD65676.1 cytochrome c oxidase assembly protein-like protein cox15 [Hyaloscypha bicolor E]
MASLLPGLRRAAPRLASDFFICHHCQKYARPAARQIKIPRKTNLSRTIRFNSSAATFPELVPKKTSPLSSLSQTISNAEKERAKGGAKKGFFPETPSNTVAYWLLASAGGVFGIVVFGGLTRLTESGLSITEWKPVTGSLPPLSASDWASEFDKYRASPEFKLLNPHMTLEEFKKIYYMEWGHRLWGRFVGLSFVLPAIYFVSRRKVSANMSLRLLGISGLIGFQGFLGWYMVKSGLKDDLFAPGSHPRVSQHRLTAHLGAAFICYTAMLWNGLSILRTNALLSHPARGLAQLTHLSSPSLSVFRNSVAGLTLLVFTTALSGGLVAGLDAGLIYNEFPRMGTGFHPPKAELFSPFYSRKSDQSDLVWRNMLENPSTVQLNHRVLATTTFTAILSLWAYSRFNRRLRGALPNGARKGMLGVVHLVLLQVTLGISTLIYLVPVPLAAAHQAGALALLTGTLVLGSRVWVPRRLMALVRQRVRQASAVTGAGKVGLGKEAMKSDLSALRRNGPPVL